MTDNRTVIRWLSNHDCCKIASLEAADRDLFRSMSATNVPSIYQNFHLPHPDRINWEVDA